jgi:hypothetical protein
MSPVRDERILIEHGVIEWQSMPLKERNDLLAKSPRPVMLLLVPDIRTRLFDAGNTDAESAISLLQAKLRSAGNVS